MSEIHFTCAKMILVVPFLSLHVNRISQIIQVLTVPVVLKIATYSSCRKFEVILVVTVFD